jgi:alkyldihydroxyacetonephosphate synthase
MKKNTYGNIEDIV